MTKDMTLAANRKDIKLVFYGIAVWVVVNFGGIATGTLQRVWPRQFATTNSKIYYFMRVKFLRVFVTVLALISLIIIALVPFTAGPAVRLFAFFSLAIILNHPSFANLTVNRISICAVSVFMKFRKLLDFFAFRTSLCYDWIRHLLLLVRSKCLGPVAAHTAVGSFYYTTPKRIFNHFIGFNNQIRAWRKREPIRHRFTKTEAAF
jgi:hypothetical protein